MEQRGGEHNRNSCQQWVTWLTEAGNKLVSFLGSKPRYLGAVFHACLFLWVCVCLHAHVFQHFSGAAITNLMPQCMRQTSNSPCMHHRHSIWPSEQTQQQAGPMPLYTECVSVCEWVSEWVRERERERESVWAGWIMSELICTVH